MGKTSVKNLREQIKIERRIDWGALGVIVILSVLYAWTMKDIPFHPDESTHIYMSKDFVSLFSDPLVLSWEGDPLLSDEERIRAIDAPLAKYIIGGIRELFSIPVLAADWDWSLSWEENRSAGALPSKNQLISARAAITVFLPISLWLYYLAFKKVLPGITALVAVSLLGLNPLFLLHGRRAMSEGILMMGIALFLWTVTRERRNPWLIGLALGICINAKHSTLGLLPAAYLAVILLPGLPLDLKKAGVNILKTSLVIILTFLLLNPFYWKDPLTALKTGVEARFNLAGEQQEDHLAQSGKLKKTIPGLVLNLYFSPVQTEEVGNYQSETQDTSDRYLSSPFHNLGRSILGGSILLTLTLAGIGRVFLKYTNNDPNERNRFLVIAIGTLGICGFTIFLLPWQRYVMPLLPFIYGWIGAGLAPFLQAKAK